MVSVKCARADMHSGVYGGSVHEAMWDVVKLMGSLNAPDGTVSGAAGLRTTGKCEDPVLRSTLARPSHRHRPSPRALLPLPFRRSRCPA